MTKNPEIIKEQFRQFLRNNQQLQTVFSEVKKNPLQPHIFFQVYHKSDCQIKSMAKYSHQGISSLSDDTSQYRFPSISAPSKSISQAGCIKLLKNAPDLQKLI